MVKHPNTVSELACETRQKMTVISREVTKIIQTFGFEGAVEADSDNGWLSHVQLTDRAADMIRVNYGVAPRGGNTQ